MNRVTKALATVFRRGRPVWLRVECRKRSPWKSHASSPTLRRAGNTDTKTFAGKLETSLDLSPNPLYLKAGGAVRRG